MATRADVAREAGVAPASVSYYINQNGYVSEETGKKIQAAIEKLHYTPNQVARSLKTKDSQQFVFLCNEIRNPFFSELVYQATKEAHKNGYTILFSNVIDDQEYLEKICSYQISGLFFSNQSVKRETLDSFLKKNVPIVMLRDKEWVEMDRRVAQLQIENSLIFQDIIDHLRQQNYDNFCYISSARSGKVHDIDEKTRYFLETAKGKVKHEAVYQISDAGEAYRFITEHYSKKNYKDAFICANDAVAVGVMRALQEMGLKIPEDVAVVGYDDTFLSKFSVPDMTSVDIQAKDLGKKIIQMLLNRISGKEVKDLIIKPRLVIRKSSCREKEV